MQRIDRLFILIAVLIASCSDSPNDVFIPLGHVNGLEPGVATYEDVIQALGRPTAIEEIQPREVAGIFLGSNTWVRYPSRGMYFLFPGPPSDTTHAHVSAIRIEAPYAGRSPEGLYLGMPLNEAKDLLNVHYALTDDLDDSLKALTPDLDSTYYYAREDNKEQVFQVWFDQNALSRIQVVAPRYVSKSLPTITNQLGMTFILLPEGRFIMGAHGYRFTEPLHEVQLSKAFYISAYETTQEQWKGLMESEPWKGREMLKTGDAYPATHVSWNDVQAFVERLNAASDSGRYRLPTEAEWEYAARAGRVTTYSFGDDPEALNHYSNYLDRDAFEALRESSYYRRYGIASLMLRGPDTTRSDGYAYTAPVGSFQPNPWGLYDMHGNVWEWVADYWGEYPAAAVKDPTGAAQGDWHVMRGGGWQEPPSSVSSGVRAFNPPSARMDVLGFRLVFEKE